MTKSTILNIPVPKKALKKLVDDAYQILATEYMGGNLWIDKDSPQKHIIILVNLIKKALEDETTR